MIRPPPCFPPNVTLQRLSHHQGTCASVHGEVSIDAFGVREEDLGATTVHRGRVERLQNAVGVVVDKDVHGPEL